MLALGWVGLANNVGQLSWAVGLIGALHAILPTYFLAGPRASQLGIPILYRLEAVNPK
jgi:hypothetical protein